MNERSGVGGVWEGVSSLLSVSTFRVACRDEAEAGFDGRGRGLPCSTVGIDSRRLE